MPLALEEIEAQVPGFRYLGLDVARQARELGWECCSQSATPTTSLLAVLLLQECT